MNFEFNVFRNRVLLTFFHVSVSQIEREHYEYEVVDGKFLHKLSGKPLDTNQGSGGSKWIFVMSTFKRLYIGEVSSKSQIIEYIMMY